MNHITLEALLVHCYNSDLFYAKKDFSQYSLTKCSAEYILWSEALNMRFAGFIFDNATKIFSSADGTPKLNLEKLFSLFPLRDWEGNEDIRLFEESLS